MGHVRSKPEDRKTHLRRIVSGSMAGETIEYAPHPTSRAAIAPELEKRERHWTKDGRRIRPAVTENTTPAQTSEAEGSEAKNSHKRKGE